MTFNLKLLEEIVQCRKETMNKQNKKQFGQNKKEKNTLK